MQQLFHEHGAHALAFDLIVGSGPTGALPHGRPTDRVVEANTTVVVDAGCYVDGYASDCTRTFATGDLPTTWRTPTTSACARSSPGSTRCVPERPAPTPTAPRGA